MTRTQTLCLLFVSGFCSITLGSVDFHLVNLQKNYSEAKTYCREMHTDLATVHNSTDMKNLLTSVSNATVRAWIGLEAGDVWMWHWSGPDPKLDFLSWRRGEPLNSSQDACAAMDEGGGWFESDCGAQRSFVCGGNSETGGDVFVAETKSWRDAQDHCRDILSDLVGIHSEEKNEAVLNVSGSRSVWIGLFRDPWKWSDGSASSFRYWKPRQPNHLRGQDCVAAIFKDQGKWNDLRCTSKRNFVCRGASKYIPTATSQVTQDALITASTTAANTLHFIPTNHSNATTKDATDLTLSTSGSEFSSTTTEMLNATTTQHPSTATVTAATDGVSTPTEASAQATKSRPTGPLDYLILVQENMTWLEALSYCRRHHDDLVQITNKDVQEKVAELAQNATSPHVWIGLRYACSFGFWFWTSSATGCYLNWAPGQESEGKYDCGVTGAVEATRGQQWVSLSETATLNFICSACVG